MSLLFTAHLILNIAPLKLSVKISVHTGSVTAGKKNLSTGVWFKQFILQGILRLDVHPVQRIFPTSITDKKLPALQ